MNRENNSRRHSDASEENEELEYSAQFASKLPLADDSDNDASPITELIPKFEDREPVVFLIGWAGCSEKNLAKYSSMYVSAGVTAIAFRPKFRRFFLTLRDQEELARQAVKFLEIANDLELEEHPIFFHVFSNNGVAFYSEVVNIILNSQTHCHLKICGAILDSCPGRPHFATILRYSIISAQEENLSTAQTLLRIICAFFFAILYPLTKALFGWSMTSRLASRDRNEHWPIYYVYSDSDKLVPFKDVELSIRFRSQNGLPVGSHRFNDSVHVAHFQKYPEEYAQHCLTFMRNCLPEIEE